MNNLNGSLVAALMGRRIFIVFNVSLSVLQRSRGIKTVSPKDLCIASVAILLVMGAGEVQSGEISKIRLHAHTHYPWSAVDSNLKAANRYKSRDREVGQFDLVESPSRAVVAQSVYGSGLMDAPTGQPGTNTGPMGFPPPQPGYGPGSMDAPSGQPGYMPAPTGLPTQQPGSMPAPTGLPRAIPAYGTDTPGAPPVQTGPNLPSTAIPPAQSDNGPGTTGSLGASNETIHTVLRATNTARMKAESLNGGLRVYRTSSCMYQQSGGQCLIKNDSGGFLFRILGGEPGWQQLGKPPTLETEILVARDGKTIVRVLYNGPPRSISTQGILPGAPQPTTIKP
jgi:hypothetical protein